jgi:hypothetical protein
MRLATAIFLEYNGISWKMKRSQRFRILQAISKFPSFGLEATADSESSRRATVKLIKRAHKRISIVSGELNADFYCNGEVQNALKASAKKGFPIQLVFGPEMSLESLERLRKLVSNFNNVTLYKLPERPLRHYILVDDTVKVQHLHPTGTKEHRTVIKRNSNSVIAAYERNFARHVEKAQII